MTVMELVMEDQHSMKKLTVGVDEKNYRVTAITESAGGLEDSKRLTTGHHGYFYKNTHEQ